MTSFAHCSSDLWHHSLHFRDYLWQVLPKKNNRAFFGSMRIIGHSQIIRFREWGKAKGKERAGSWRPRRYTLCVKRSPMVPCRPGKVLFWPCLPWTQIKSNCHLIRRLSVSIRDKCIIILSNCIFWWWHIMFWLQKATPWCSLPIIAFRINGIWSLHIGIRVQNKMRVYSWPQFGILYGAYPCLFQ